MLSSKRIANSVSLAHYNHIMAARIDTGLNEPIDDESVLHVQNMEFYTSHNGQTHNTDKFELVADNNVPVWRRGQSVLLSIRCSQYFNSEEHNMKIIFNFGAGSSVPEGTIIALSVTNNSQIDMADTSDWGVQVNMNREEGNILVLDLMTASDSAVGAYRFSIETSNKDRPEDLQIFKPKDPVYLLFNPYNSGDAVYMPNTEDIDEYVLNDNGKIWIGTYKQIKGKPWIFGQFEDSVLPAACFVLDSSSILPIDRKDPIKVCRVISAMVNENDDKGVVQGNWSGEYKDGVSPWKWTGSAAILEQYLANRGSPVKYGQCWVFSGVVTTICRALGIPCRSVSNFVSGHDTNRSLTIDKFFRSDGDQLKAEDRPDIGSKDTVWNFHSWNDVYMTRPDLPPGYGGWQAIDSTPQETSDKKFQCGPAPLEAVRTGMGGLGYDVPFVFAEVNADLCHFTEDINSPWGFSRSNSIRYHVGRRIVTSKVGAEAASDGSDMEDITAEYKNKEGSEDEWQAVLNAVKGISKARKIYDYPTKADVQMDMEDLEQVNFGEEYSAKIKIKNNSDEDRTLRALISSYSIYYNGVKANRIKKSQGTFVLEPGQEENLELTISPEDYMGKLVEYCMLKIYAMIRVVETNQVWSEEDDFLLDKPDLHLEILEDLTTKQKGHVKISFTNPLDEILTNCSFILEASGVIRQISKNHPNVGAGEVVEATFAFQPRRPGSTRLVCKFNSDQMIDVNGFLSIIVS